MKRILHCYKGLAPQNVPCVVYLYFLVSVLTVFSDICLAFLVMWVSSLGLGVGIELGVGACLYLVRIVVIKLKCYICLLK